MLLYCLLDGLNSRVSRFIPFPVASPYLSPILTLWEMSDSRLAEFMLLMFVMPSKIDGGCLILNGEELFVASAATISSWSFSSSCS